MTVSMHPWLQRVAALSTFVKVLACFGAGAISVLAFAPFAMAWVPFMTLPVLMVMWLMATPKQGALAGYFFGLGLFLVGTSWVYNSLSIYGGMPLWMGSIAVLGFASIMAGFIALCGWVICRITAPLSFLRLLAIPLGWTFFEWCKSWVLTGFPWLDLGYSQTHTILFHWAPVGGVYLIGFVVVTLIALALHPLVVRRSIALLLLIPALLLCSWGLGKPSWGEPVGPSLEVGIVQPNTPIERKWGIQYRNAVLSNLRQANRELLQLGRLDLVVWPETALPALRSQTGPEFWRDVRPDGAALITGLIDRVETPQRIDDYNAAVLDCDDGQMVYRKRHLVPFGEYLPLRFLFQWVLDYLQLPMSDLSSWSQVQSLSCGSELKVGLSICYEDAFSGEHRAHTMDATILVNISEDAWFGDSFAPHQRLQMAQMRAKELALPLIRSANSGPSVFIDHRGRIQASTVAFEAATLRHAVQPRMGRTPYRQFGPWLIVLCSMGLVWLTLVSRRRG